jgi:hypothetical protein
MKKLVNNKNFYALLNEGLFCKYCKIAGPVQMINITYARKDAIHILKIQLVFDVTEIDFIGDFIEEKTINADLSTAQHIKTKLQNVQGTLFVKNNVFDDLILEVS